MFFWKRNISRIRNLSTEDGFPAWRIAAVSARFFIQFQVINLNYIAMKNSIKMSKLHDRKKLAWEGMFYSIQRIDLLIVSICGFGIYVCLETIKFLSEKNQDTGLLIKISAGCFLIGIIINFLSQIFGHKSNEQDYFMCEAEIDAGESPTKNEQKEIKDFDRKSECFSKWTDILNYVSMGSMFSGLILIMCYFLFTF